MEFDKAWPTIIGRSKFDSLELSQHILMNYDMSNPPADKYGYNIFDDDSSYMKNFEKIAYNTFDEYLQKTIEKSISDYEEYKMRAWITGHDDKYCMAMHNHTGAQISAVFYVVSEDQNSGGALNLIDPRSNANRGYDEWFNPMFEDIRIIPKTGDIVMFPSYLYHAVQPYYSRFRIAVPVDLYLYRD